MTFRKWARRRVAKARRILASRVKRALRGLAGAGAYTCSDEPRGILRTSPFYFFMNHTWPPIMVGVYGPPEDAAATYMGIPAEEYNRRMAIAYRGPRTQKEVGRGQRNVNDQHGRVRGAWV